MDCGGAAEPYPCSVQGGVAGGKRPVAAPKNLQLLAKQVNDFNVVARQGNDAPVLQAF
jgi:hypothetical protein